MALGLLRACHPGPTVTVTTIVVSLALGAGQRWAALPMGAAVLTGQLSVGWSNDVCDEQRDRAAGRVDKPIACGAVPRGMVKHFIVVALVLCVVLSLAVGWLAGTVHLVAVAAGWAYNLALKGSPFSLLPYAVAFAALPAFVSLSLPGHPWPAPWVTVAGSLLGTGAHFVNVLPDLEQDRATGVRGLPQRLGAAGSLAMGAAMMGGSLLLIACRPACQRRPAWCGVHRNGGCGSAGGHDPRRRRRDVPSGLATGDVERVGGDVGFHRDRGLSLTVSEGARRVGPMQNSMCSTDAWRRLAAPPRRRRAPRPGSAPIRQRGRGAGSRTGVSYPTPTPLTRLRGCATGCRRDPLDESAALSAGHRFRLGRPSSCLVKVSDHAT